MTTNEPMAYVTKDENGNTVLVDPMAAAVVQTVNKLNCDKTFELQIDRIQHFKQRAVTLQQPAQAVVIVIINADTNMGRPLAEALMPNHDWDTIRSQGEIPFARGLAQREGIQSVLDELAPEAAESLRNITNDYPVIVIDYEACCVYAV